MKIEIETYQGEGGTSAVGFFDVLKLTCVGSTDAPGASRLSGAG
ncbi:hypothetical protein [Paraburkholderia guartelaensis]|nr:hypothetical protein [Paraburkholderia guartelaensis]